MRICFPMAVLCIVGCWILQSTLIAPPARELFAAIERNDRDGIQNALAAGQSLEARDENGHTPLIAAARAGDVETVRALLSAGAKLNAVANDGQTALAHAARRGNREVVQLLCDRGARLGLDALTIGVDVHG
jgi:hypothetical protein